MEHTIRGIRPENKVVEVRKLSDGSLRAVRANGSTFVVSAESELAQAFVVYTMLNAQELAA